MQSIAVFNPLKIGAASVNLEGYLTVKQVAERLGIPPSTASRYVAKGFFPGAFKLNPFALRRSEWRIPEASVMAFEEKQRETATKPRGDGMKN